MVFLKGENVLALDQYNNQLARGLSSFSSEEINKIKGSKAKKSKDFGIFEQN